MFFQSWTWLAEDVSGRKMSGWPGAAYHHVTSGFHGAG